MRRVVATFPIMACAVVAALAGLAALAAGAVEPRPGDARARLVSCHPALDQVDRSLTVDSVMRSLVEEDRMQMRFDLHQRLGPARRYRRLPGPGLGVWNAATPGVDRFRFRKPIQNLPAPAAYFVKVSYRWLDAEGEVLVRTVRRTRLCLQGDRRPDLRVGALLGVRRTASGDFAYRVVLRNAGRTASGDFEAVLTVASLPRPARTIDGLAAGERRTVELVGPRCAPGELARVELDPDGRVDEADELNNSRSFTCL